MWLREATRGAEKMSGRRRDHRVSGFGTTPASAFDDGGGATTPEETTAWNLVTCEHAMRAFGTGRDPLPIPGGPGGARLVPRSAGITLTGEIRPVILEIDKPVAAPDLDAGWTSSRGQGTGRSPPCQRYATRSTVRGKAGRGPCTAAMHALVDRATRWPPVKGIGITWVRPYSTMLGDT